MGRIVGFTAHGKIAPEQKRGIEEAEERALAHFPWLERRSEQLGPLTIRYWGSGGLSQRRFESGTDVVLVLGSPVGAVDGAAIGAADAGGVLPWDGRVLVVRLARDGSRLRLDTDWLGSIPVYRLESDEELLATTLEPCAAAAARRELSAAGLVTLLMNGHFEDRWTLTQGVVTSAPDSTLRWDGRWSVPERRNTVSPSSERTEHGWDELVEELEQLTVDTIARTLDPSPRWIIPLSCGMDSRLTAAVAKERGIEVETYTYGHGRDVDVTYAKQVALELALDWRFVELGGHYLVEWTRLWADWFGSAMHFHGMYQLRFLTSLHDRRPAPIAHGYMGDPLAGNHISALVGGAGFRDSGHALAEHWTLWPRDEIEALVRQPVDAAFDEVAQARRDAAARVAGPEYKRLMFLDFWNRQRLLISYQPIMYDYWRGVGTPFFAADYANFWLSLPRAALDDRRLQKSLLERRYPRLAAIPGSFATHPLVVTDRYAFKRRLSRIVPRPLLRGPLAEFDTPYRHPEIECLRATGVASLWPLQDALGQLEDIIDPAPVRQAMTAALAGDITAYQKCSAIQALALWKLR
jgi:hypothetical protein